MCEIMRVLIIRIFLPPLSHDLRDFKLSAEYIVRPNYEYNLRWYAYMFILPIILLSQVSMVLKFKPNKESQRLTWRFIIHT